MRSNLLLAVLLAALTASVAPARAQTGPTPHVVIALVDQGINPYSLAFRDDSPLAQQHPSTYIPGYPESALELRLTLDAPTLAEALTVDAQVWEDVVGGFLYWVPGTKIIGAVSLGTGGRDCRLAAAPPPAHGQVNSRGTCLERPIFDDGGHGTMTASRAAATTHSLAPGARIVSVEGLGEASVDWIAKRSWIDVQSNSWGTALPVDRNTGRTFAKAALSQMVLVASGNGVGFSGFAPQPTLTDPLGAPGVILVGGHDNGRVTAWSGAPAHVVADAYGGYAASNIDNDGPRPNPYACCTSASAPYAAGGAAALAYEARRILGHASTGVHDGVVAAGPAGLVDAGPLADGVFTMAEWRDVFLHTAQARPLETGDDGWVQFTGEPGSVPHHPEYGPGENPFCFGCWTLPVLWKDVPEDRPAHLSIGYGGINTYSRDLAMSVLMGTASIPARPEVDDFFAQEEPIRRFVTTGE